jgi:RNA-binding protein YhbY
MPIERCILEDLEQCVEQIEKKNRIINVQVIGRAAVILFEPRRQAQGERETRGGAQ